LALAFGLWPVLIAVVLTGYPVLTLSACLALGLLFAALPTLVTLFVVQNTTAQDYGPSFAAATLCFGIAQTIAPPIGGFIADQSGTFFYVFLLSGAVSLIGMVASLGLPETSAR
jgi:MFS family permease